MKEALQSAVTRQGFAFLSRILPDQIPLHVFERIGDVVAVGDQRTQELRPRHHEEAPSNIYSGNYGLGEFPLHSDLAHWYIPPRYLVLRCVQGAADVYTQLLDTRLITKVVGRSILRRTLAHPRRPVNGRLPLLRILEEPQNLGALIRWDSLFIKPATEASAKTFKNIRGVLSEVPIIRHSLCSPGDMLVIDNWRMLHGRSAVSPTALDRHISRAYLSRLL